MDYSTGWKSEPYPPPFHLVNLLVIKINPGAVTHAALAGPPLTVSSFPGPPEGHGRGGEVAAHKFLRDQ